jgi:hypothetical protein
MTKEERKEKKRIRSRIYYANNKDKIDEKYKNYYNENK